MKVISLKLVDFQDLVECKALSFQCKDSFLPVTYQFKPGKVYGLLSDFGCGSWGLACLGGEFTEHHGGKSLVNDKTISASELYSASAFISENLYSGINDEGDLLTPLLCIEKALSISNEPYTVEQIKTMFCLSDERFERSLLYSSGEIWLISMAVNFALEKQIFCYPWLNAMDIKRFEAEQKLGIINLLKNSGKIIIVPSSQKRILKKLCDHIIKLL